LPESEMKQKTLDLCDKRDEFSPSYDHLLARRTSNRTSSSKWTEISGSDHDTTLSGDVTLSGPVLRPR
jgi:hypothetical protein